MPRPSSRTAAQFARAGLQKAHALCAELRGLEFLWGPQETEVCLVMEELNSETPKCTGNLQCYGLSVLGRISIPTPAFVWWKIHRKLLSFSENRLKKPTTIIWQPCLNSFWIVYFHSCMTSGPSLLLCTVHKSSFHSGQLRVGIWEVQSVCCQRAGKRGHGQPLEIWLQEAASKAVDLMDIKHILNRWWCV